MIYWLLDMKIKIPQHEDSSHGGNDVKMKGKIALRDTLQRVFSTEFYTVIDIE